MQRGPELVDEVVDEEEVDLEVDLEVEQEVDKEVVTSDLIRHPGSFLVAPCMGVRNWPRLSSG